jgi:hypothetical protein
MAFVSLYRLFHPFLFSITCSPCLACCIQQCTM